MTWSTCQTRGWFIQNVIQRYPWCHGLLGGDVGRGWTRASTWKGNTIDGSSEHWFLLTEKNGPKSEVYTLDGLCASAASAAIHMIHSALVVGFIEEKVRRCVSEYIGAIYDTMSHLLMKYQCIRKGNLNSNRYSHRNMVIKHQTNNRPTSTHRYTNLVLRGLTCIVLQFIESDVWFPQQDHPRL